jgi:hypothetical protein
MMRAAFRRHGEGPGVHRRSRQKKLTLEPEDGECMDRLIDRIYATPKPIVERIAALIK